MQVLQVFYTCMQRGSQQMNLGFTSLRVQPQKKVDFTPAEKANKKKNTEEKSAFKALPAQNTGIAPQQDDILSKPPWRWLAYSNGVGEALLGPIFKGAIPSVWRLGVYAPAFMYMGADVFDKYNKGEDGKYTKPSVNKFIEQTVYQTFASMVLTYFAQAGGRNLTLKALDFAQKNLKLDSIKKVNRTAAGILGGITGLALLAKPIDKFTDKYIVKTALQPMLYEDRRNEFMDKYISHNIFIEGLTKSSLLGQHLKGFQPPSLTV